MDDRELVISTLNYITHGNFEKRTDEEKAELIQKILARIDELMKEDI